MNTSSPSLPAVAAAAVSVVVGLLTALHLINWSHDQTLAVTNLAVFGVGSGLLVFAWLHSWNSATYDVGQVTSGVTAALSLLLAVLSAFNVFSVSADLQASLTAVAGLLALAGSYVFATLHTHQSVQRQIARGTRIQPAPSADPAKTLKGVGR